MSEKIYAWLLRLYPSNFKEAYGEDAMQVFRDRAREERGLLPGLQLWLDLLVDLAVSLPREYRSVPSPVVASPTPYLGNRTPSFHTLEAQAFGFRSMLYGGVASLAGYSCIFVLIGHGNPLAHTASDRQRLPRYSETIAKRLPTIALTYSPAKPAAGSIINLTATVSAIGGPTPTGNVRFFDGSGILNTSELDNGTVTVKARLSYTAKHILRRPTWAMQNIVRRVRSAKRTEATGPS